MPSTLPNRAVRSQLNSLRATSAKARIDANTVEPSALMPLVKQAMSESGLSQKELAINAGQPESVISDALNCRRNFAADWLWRQPDHFLVKFLDLMTDARQLTPENTHAIRRRRIVELIDLLLTECA